MLVEIFRGEILRLFGRRIPAHGHGMPTGSCTVTRSCSVHSTLDSPVPDTEE